VVLIAAGFFVCNGCRENGSLKKNGVFCAFMLNFAVSDQI